MYASVQSRHKALFEHVLKARMSMLAGMFAEIGSYTCPEEIQPNQDDGVFSHLHNFKGKADCEEHFLMPHPWEGEPPRKSPRVGIYERFQSLMSKR